MTIKPVHVPNHYDAENVYCAAEQTRKADYWKKQYDDLRHDMEILATNLIAGEAMTVSYNGTRAKVAKVAHDH